MKRKKEVLMLKQEREYLEDRSVSRVKTNFAGRRGGKKGARYLSCGDVRTRACGARGSNIDR